jgi:hypothetical protein
VERKKRKEEREKSVLELRVEIRKVLSAAIISHLVVALPS